MIWFEPIFLMSLSLLWTITNTNSEEKNLIKHGRNKIRVLTANMKTKIKNRQGGAKKGEAGEQHICKVCSPK